ncbi:hypothetical protein MNEG_6122 [Monoraphidium neglectum]|uniref:Tandem-95 repeat protein n=1 Tax=Monoraphidium neglectum TaxID=145388 RepID=A0A0D2MFB5_9CHLO|nr:hypothetical protein MNEG_6122 [Monoraphidium neglectum]KIZ01835.1 hypothetical protein MNEG_6122 [Monoraphidium neglectum]|eukprot:XP_013900854.1 hypothetical protein MNEG_6122 [Monoraphidium neglectum]
MLGPVYNATCAPIEATCRTAAKYNGDNNAKCLGTVRCQGDACPDWEGVACFWLGKSDNWKVCGSPLCTAGGAPKFGRADAPSQCVFGGFKGTATKSGYTYVQLSPDFDNQNKCKIKGYDLTGGNGQCSTCVAKCCAATGRCPRSSCKANSLGTEERNCPNSSRCPVGTKDGYTATCEPHEPKCLTNGGTNCFGWVKCTGKACPDFEGMICIYSGASTNWKLCADRTCPTSPDMPASADDKCDPIEMALQAGDGVDDRTAAFCEYKNWRTGGANPLTGYKGRCKNADSTKCHGNCDISTGLCPSSSCIANALGDENLNCPRSARCPVRRNGAVCDTSVYGGGTCTGPHCLGQVKCAAATPCPDYQGMDCVMDGGSDNFKLCFSTGCFTGGGKTTQSPAAVRVQAQATVTVASGATCSTALPPLGSLGGEAFLAALAATLNVYKDRIENAKCSGDDADFLDTVVVPPGKGTCSCKDVRTLLDDANLALSDQTEQPYDTETSLAIPLDEAQACLEQINTAGKLTSAGGVADDQTTCPATEPGIEPSDPFIPAPGALPGGGNQGATISATDDAYTCGYNGQLTTAAGSLTGNDASSLAGALTIISNTQPSVGTVVVKPDGSFVYTPPAGFSGAATFTYTVQDTGGNKATATVTILVPAPPTPPPAAGQVTATADLYTCAYNGQLTTAAGSLLGNDASSLGGPLTVVGSSQPTVGTLTVNPDGSFTYQPPAGYSGTVTFTYTVRDAAGNLATATATVAIVVPPPPPGGNPAPAVTATNDFYTCPYNGALNTLASGSVLSNDVQSSGGILTVASNTNPAHGTVVMQPDGSFVYTPNAGFNGTDTFTYTAKSAAGDTATATVTINVPAQPNPAPAVGVVTAGSDAYNCTYNGSLTTAAGSLLANDASSLGGALTVVSNTQPSVGTVVVNADGSFVFTPPGGFSGNATFTPAW